MGVRAGNGGADPLPRPKSSAALLPCLLLPPFCDEKDRLGIELCVCFATQEWSIRVGCGRLLLATAVTRIHKKLVPSSPFTSVILVCIRRSAGRPRYRSAAPSPVDAMLLSSSQAGRAAVRASQKRVAPTVAPMGSAAFAATRHSARTVATEIAAGSQTLRPSRPPLALVSKRVGKGRLHLSAQHLRASPLESLTQQGQRGDGGDEHVVGGLQRTSTTAAQSADDGPVVAIDDTHSKINITWSSGTESR